MSSPQMPRPMNVADASRRRRFRRNLAIALLVPLLEIVVLIAVAGRVGSGAVLLVVLLSAAVGIAVVRRGTPRAWATLRELAGQGPTPEHHLSRDAQASSGRVLPTGSPFGPGAGSRPGAAANLGVSGENLKAVGVDLTEDLLLLVCGIMLVWPGLITTALGLVLLIPVVRRLFAGRLGNKAASATTARVERFVQTSRVQLSDGIIHGETVDGARYTPQDEPPAATPPQLEK